MPFEIKLQVDGPPLSFEEGLTPEIKQYQVFPTVKAATGSWGGVISQVLVTPDFQIWHYNYNVNREVSFYISADIEVIVLHFAYKNSIEWEDIKLGSQKFRAGQFNLTYFPSVNVKLNLPVGEYISFAIAYPKQYLYRFIRYLPSLKSFLYNTEKGITCHLSTFNDFASPEMHAALHAITQQKFLDDLSNVYTECKALELLTLAITKISRKKDSRFMLTGADIDQFHYAKNWLTENVDNPGSLGEIAKRFGINEFKLKKGFKELFGETVFEHLFSVRMERARNQLLTTDMSVSEIAYRAGYSNHSHFAVAFKKHFNYSPNYLRKK